MSFPYKFKTIRSGSTYDSNALSEMAAHEGEVVDEIETGANEGNSENGVRFSPTIADEKIKARLESLHAQISAFTEMMVRLIQSNSAEENTTARSRVSRHQSELLNSEVPGSSGFPTMAPFSTAGHSSDTDRG